MRRLRVVRLLVALVAVLVGGSFFVKSPRVQLFGGLTSRVNTAEKVVALTFDDGPTPGDTPAVLAVLNSIVTRLSARGYRFVTVNELLAQKWGVGPCAVGQPGWRLFSAGLTLYP